MASAVLFHPVVSDAQTAYTRIASFDALSGAGVLPHMELVECSDGWLYGATSSGGANGSGCIYRISKSGGGLAPIFNFPVGNSASGRLIELGDGTLCGTTGGSSSDAGMIYKVNKDGSGFTVLHAFPAFTNDGGKPTGGVVAGTKGYLYGVTFGGGISGNGTTNKGTVFRLKTDGGSYSILHSFGDTNDAASPIAAPCLGSDGVLYGATQAGGSNGMGAVFRMNTDGTGYSVLRHFGGPPSDGQLPLCQLMEGGDGFLYGTTHLGGSNSLGTIFKLAKGVSGTSYTVLRHLNSGSEGHRPWAGLVQGTNGLLYGTARYGGAGGYGTVFRLAADGTEYTVLHAFPNDANDGSQPLAALLQASDGNFYGSTHYGKNFEFTGTLFKLSLVLPGNVIITSITPASGSYLLSFAGGVPGQNYQVLATTNQLTQNWVQIGSAMALTDGTFQFTDSMATNYPSRFYRSRQP